MRIVCTVTNDLAQDQRMDRICRSLVAAGHDVTLVGRLLPDSRPLSPRPYATHRIRCRYHRGKAFYLEYNWRLWRTLRRWTFDAVCSVDLDTLVAGRLLKARGRKLVFDAHEWFSETPEVVGRPLVRTLWRAVGRWLVPATDARYTVAPELARKLAEEYGRPFATVRNLPLRSDMPPVAVCHQSPFVLLYQGMLNPGRGLEQLVEALGQLPECRLLIVGSGPSEGAVRRCVERTNTGDRVDWAGFVAPERLPELTRRGWLGVNLLDARSPSYYYSLANKALDYVQAGLPSLQMDFPEYRHLARAHDCYVLVPDLTVAGLAATIRELMDDPARYTELCANCRTAAAHLHWEAEERVLRALWEQLP